MQEVSVIIPNFNGMAYLDGVLAGLECQTVSNFDVILVDNGSNDGSCAFVAARYPWVHLIELPENFGFCKAVNEGIRASRSPYVLLLNNDIEVTENFIEEMLSAIKRHPKAFSCAARMIQFHDRDRLDDAGNYYCALGWAYARGKGKDIHTYEKEEKIFASCAGAAMRNTQSRERFSSPAPGLRSTEEKSLKRSDILTKNILHIWRTWMWDTGPGSTDMKTGTHLMPWYTMWEAVPADPDIISSRSGILPEIIFI